MEIVKREYQVYSASELQDDILEKVIDKYCDNDSYIDMNNDTFCEDITLETKDLYGLDIEPHYSLGHCQGDGFSFNCKNLLSDKMVQYIKKQLESKKDKIILQAILDSGDRFYSKHRDNYYCYASQYDIDYTCDYYTYKYYADRHQYTKLTESDFDNAIHNIEQILIDWYLELCIDYTTQGYEQIYYRLTKEDFIDLADCNGWKFLENGEFFD